LRRRALRSRSLALCSLCRRPFDDGIGRCCACHRSHGPSQHHARLCLVIASRRKRQAPVICRAANGSDQVAGRCGAGGYSGGASKQMNNSIKLALAGLFGCLPMAAKAETALQLQASCHEVGNATPVGQSQGVYINDYEGGFCWGEFGALQALIGAQDLTLKLCLPDAGTRLELVQVFLKYLDSHPNESGMQFVTVALHAFATAYPCPR
jgi:hypothetical protein